MNTPREWEEELESFDSFFAGLPREKEKKAIYLYEKYIIDFIRTLLDKAREEERERVIRKLDELVRYELPKHAEMNGYGCAIDDVRTALNEKESNTPDV